MKAKSNFKVHSNQLNRLILKESFFLFLNRVCDEFESVKARALKQPETIEELNDTLKFMEVAKSTGYQALIERIKALVTSMQFLLDTHLFPKEDIDLNARVLMWPADIQPVFDENEEVLYSIRFLHSFIR